MKHVRRIVCVAIIAIMMAGLMACSAPVQESQAPAAGASETVSQEPSASATGSDAASAKSSGAGFPFELTTFDGEVVTFDHVPERVLAANPDAGEELMALGLGDKIIATSYNYAQVAEEYRAEYEAKQSLTDSGYPALEAVLGLDPDFVYGRSAAFDQKGIASHDTLTENGIMSLSSIESYKMGADVEDVYQDFYNLGRIFQVEDKANEIVDDMKSRIAAVEEKVADAQPVKVFNFDSEEEGGAYTAGNNFTSSLIRHAGGVNVFGDLEETWGTVSWEAVVEANPDIIVINDYSGTTLDEKIRQLKENPALSGLKAVQEENFLVITLPEVFASSRAADTIEKFAQAFHPELFVE